MDNSQPGATPFRYLSNEEFLALSRDEQVRYLQRAFVLTKQRINRRSEQSLPAYSRPGINPL